jgi:hypothetical protein
VQENAGLYAYIMEIYFPTSSQHGKSYTTKRYRDIIIIVIATTTTAKVILAEN